MLFLFQIILHILVKTGWHEEKNLQELKESNKMPISCKIHDYVSIISNECTDELSGLLRSLARMLAQGNISKLFFFL